MKFKVGDVCEIVSPSQPSFHGAECVVTNMERWVDCLYDPVTYDPYPPGPNYDIQVSGMRYPLHAMEHELRLKRPPAWDKWLYDTSDVKDEKRIGMPA